MEDEAVTGGFVVALIENRAKEVGVAAYDPHNNRLHLTQARARSALMHEGSEEHTDRQMHVRRTPVVRRNTGA
jgi:hypothetical protein